MFPCEHGRFKFSKALLLEKNPQHYLQIFEFKSEPINPPCFYVIILYSHYYSALIEHLSEKILCLILSFSSIIETLLQCLFELKTGNRCTALFTTTISNHSLIENDKGDKIYFKYAK